MKTVHPSIGEVYCRAKLTREMANELARLKTIVPTEESLGFIAGIRRALTVIYGADAADADYKQAVESAKYL